MKQTSELLARFNRMVPPGVTPKFSTVEEWQAWQQQEGRKRCEVIEAQNRQAKTVKLLGRAGIRELHSNCTFLNYHVTCDEQRHAYTMAKSWLARYGTCAGGFVFCGCPGTGKNHLASAIGHQLIAGGKTVMIVTVADMMTQLRARYRGKGTEEEFLKGLCESDLLVIDEVGVQLDTRNEQVIVNQIVERRTAARRPVGILTNLNSTLLTQLLGERIIDRLKMDGGIWVNFTWESYRPKVRSSRTTYS